jgi:hypothetical protein
MSLLQIAYNTGRMNYVCSNAAKHELEPVAISAHCALFHRKPSPTAHSSRRAPEQAVTAKRKT